MGSIAEWQSLKVQEYRYKLLIAITRFWELFGVRRPVRFEPPPPAGEYDDAINASSAAARSFLEQYISSLPRPEPRLGGPPPETTEPNSPDVVDG